MKKIIAASIAASLLLSYTSTYASPVTITTPDQKTISGSDVQIRKGKMMIPIRDLARAIGATLSTDPVHHKVALKKWGERYVFTIEKAQYRINDRNSVSELNVVVQQINGRTYIPSDFLGSLGYEINSSNKVLRIESPLSTQDSKTLYHGDLASARELVMQLIMQIPTHGEQQLLENHEESEAVDNQFLFPKGEVLRMYYIYGDVISLIEFKEDFPVITWQARLPKQSTDHVKDFLSYKLKEKWGSVPLKNKDYVSIESGYFGDSTSIETGIIQAGKGYYSTGHEYTVGGSVTSMAGKISFVMPEEKRID